jgi:hypothetical protein
MIPYYESFTYTAYSEAPGSIISPEDGSTLEGTSVGFSWEIDASRYWLWIGSSQGASNVYNSGYLYDPYDEVDGLPDDGRTLYVRLWYEVAGIWKYYDYTYTAYTAE